MGLERLLFHKLDRRLRDLVGDAVGMEEAVFRLIETATDEGWVGELVAAALKDRPGNAQLRAWAGRHLAPPPAAAAVVLPPDQQLFDSAYFDLHPIKRRITEATITAGGSGLIGFGVPHPEMLFVDKLCEWLREGLGDLDLACKGWLSLRPHLSSVDERIKHVSEYLGELASANVVCKVYADGVPRDIVGAFWQGVRDQCGQPDKWFVFVFAGALTDGYPPGIVVLDRPVFDVTELMMWAQRVVSRLNWPAQLAAAWCGLIAEKSGDPQALDARLMYDTMDRLLGMARHDAAGFRRLLEERV